MSLVLPCWRLESLYISNTIIYITIILNFFCIIDAEYPEFSADGHIGIQFSGIVDSIQ